MFRREALCEVLRSFRAKHKGMPVPKVVEVMINCIKKDKFEILPGMNKMLKLAGRFTL